MDYNAFKLRWFVENCCEIKLPSGKTIVIDPMLSKDKDSDDMWKKQFYSGFGPEDLEGCDTIIISHVHGDHIASLAETYDRFGAPIMINGITAPALMMHEDIAPGAFIPVSVGTTLNFDEYKLTMLAGRHTPRVTAPKPSETKLFAGDEAEKRFGLLGSIVNNNYLITLKNNFRIALDSGLYEGDISEWEKYKPNLVLRHYEPDADYHVESFAEILKRSGAQYILPLCVQKYSLEEREEISAKVNEYCASHGIPGRSIVPVAGQWMTFNLGYTIG